MSGDARGTNLPDQNLKVPSLGSVLQGKKVKTMAAKFETGGSETAAPIKENYSREDSIGRNIGKGGIGTNQGSC